MPRSYRSASFRALAVGCTLTSALLVPCAHAAPGGGPNAAARQTRQTVLPYFEGNLVAFVESELLPSIPSVPGTGRNVSPAAQRNHYVPPTAEQLYRFRRVIRAMIASDFIGAQERAKAISDTYNLVEFVDTATGEVHYVLMEGVPGSIPAPANHPHGVHITDPLDPRRRGWGTFIINPNSAKRVGFSAPHPKDDLETGALAVEAYVATNGRTLSIAGTDRDQNHVLGNCNQSSRPFREADMAHSPQSMFQVAFEEIYRSEKKVYHIQFHGNATCGTDVYLSNGVATPPGVMNALAYYLLSSSATAAGNGPMLSVDVYDGPGSCSLRGTKNTQLRFAADGLHNGVCNYGPFESSRFIHLEARRRVRRAPSDPQAAPGVNRSVLVEAIRLAF